MHEGGGFVWLATSIFLTLSIVPATGNSPIKMCRDNEFMKPDGSGVAPSLKELPPSHETGNSNM